MRQKQHSFLFSHCYTFYNIVVLIVINDNLLTLHIKNTFAEYYFGFTYQMLVSADQKNYIISALSIVTVILNTLVSVILINMNFSIHIVKLGSSLVNIISPLYLYFYCITRAYFYTFATTCAFCIIY